MTTLPDIKDIAKFLTATLRRNVDVKAIKPVPGTDLIIGGHYVNGAQALVGGCFSDLSLAAYAGAAFSLIPADAAKDCLKAKELDEFMQENFAEVLNICSRLFDGGVDRRVTLTVVENPGTPRSDTSKAMLQPTAKRLDLDVDIAGYGKGRMTLALSPA